MQMRNRVALVIQGDEQMGMGISLRLAGAGASVALFAPSLEQAQAVAEAVKEVGRSSLALQVDITDAAQVSGGMQQVVKRLGSLDILVNSPDQPLGQPFIEVPLEAWRRIVDINFGAVLLGCRAALEHMVPRNYGRIINIVSDAARVGPLRESVYAGAKNAVIAFSKSLAVEVARNGVTVNAVSVGAVDTPRLREGLTPEGIQRLERQNLLRRLGTPEDVANAVAFFAADASEYLTGQVLSVNGGAFRFS